MASSLRKHRALSKLCAELLLLEPAPEVPRDCIGPRQWRTLGITEADRHRLIRAGLVRSFTGRGQGRKEATWFALSTAGLKAAFRTVQALLRRRLPPDARTALGLAGEKAQEPHWDRQRKELSWGSVLVKRFRNPAPDQEAVLDAFEKAGWPPYIPSPLLSSAVQSAKTHLQETIKSLNWGHKWRLIRFGGTGAGPLGVC
jgi:hypothetical protein